jgi:hypothetical protein
MEASDQLYASAALPPGKEISALSGPEAGWAPESVWMLWMREKSLGLLTVLPVVCRYAGST